MMIPLNTEFPVWTLSLIVDFPDDDVPLLYSEDKWKEWGNELVQRTTFAQNGCSGTQSYDDKWDWAMSIFNSMANY